MRRQLLLTVWVCKNQAILTNLIKTKYTCIPKQFWRLFYQCEVRKLTVELTLQHVKQSLINSDLDPGHSQTICKITTLLPNMGNLEITL